MHAAMMALRTKVCMGGIAFLPTPSMKVMSQPMPTPRMTSMTGSRHGCVQSAAMPTLFFTGYPGFLGSELLPRLLRRDPGATALCLVQPKFAALARERARPLGERVRLVEGDITSAIDASPDDVTEIYHLAAIYDLAVPRDLGMRVNVDGTCHVLDFAERCHALRRFEYVSTCYISGYYSGVFRETDLDLGQR